MPGTTQGGTGVPPCVRSRPRTPSQWVRSVPRLAALSLAGKLPVDRLISHRIGLDEVNEASDAMRRGERARSVIVF